MSYQKTRTLIDSSTNITYYKYGFTGDWRKESIYLQMINERKINAPIVIGVIVIGFATRAQICA